MSHRIPLVLALIVAPLAMAADWPQFRGPNGSGISPEKGLPLKWSAKDGVAWKTDLPGAGASSPVFIGNRIFLTAWTGYAVPGQAGGAESDLRFHLICLDRKTGKIEWDKAIPATGIIQKPSRGGEGFASSTPVVDAERVYCFFGTSGLFAFDYSGKQLWQAGVGNRKSDWISAASPIIHGDLVIMNASIESDSVIAFDKKTGKEIWRAKGIKQAWNTPVVVKNTSGKDELLVATQPKIMAFDPATGADLWNCDTESIWYMVPSIVAHEGVAYSLGGRTGVVGLSVKTGGKGDVTKTHRTWTSKKGTNVSSPVFHDGHLFWMNDASGTAFCAKAATGEIVYEERVERGGEIYASSLLADGRIYYVSRDGRTFVLAAKPEYDLLATNDLRDGSTFESTPVAVDGRLFIRSNKALYCLEKK